MKILAIDGAFGTFSCAVGVDGKIAAQQRVQSGATLENGLGAVCRALDDATLTAGDLDRLAVCTGPGTFTGLRIAISFAKSLAQGWRKPLVGIGAFDLLELGTSTIPRLAVICAREGIISVRLTLAGNMLRESGPVPKVCTWVAEHVRGKELTVTGAPEDVLSALGERGKLVHNLRSPLPARALVELAETREPARAIHEVRPDYGEPPPVK